MGPLGIPTPEEEYIKLALGMEIFATMVIHIVRISLLIDNRGHKDSNGLALGSAYTAMVLASAPISGACFNPARAIGPLFALDKSTSNNQLVMALAPFIGCTAGMFIYKRWLISDELEDELDEL